MHPKKKKKKHKSRSETPSISQLCLDPQLNEPQRSNDDPSTQDTQTEGNNAVTTHTYESSSANVIAANDIKTTIACELEAPTSSIAEKSSDSLSVFSPEEGKKILERFFTVMVMANLSPHVVLKPFCGHKLNVEMIQQALQENGWTDAFIPIEVKALRSLGEDSIYVQQLYDQASAIAFRVELCEFQLRTAICDQQQSNVKAPRARVDLQRRVTRLLAHLPPEETSVTSKQFENLMEKRLALTPGRFLTKIVFARICRRPFQRSFPSSLEYPRASFCEALEVFCMNPSLSLDCVEGQLRHLVDKYTDLRQCFQVLDMDQSGSISMEEFVEFLQREAHMHFPEDVLRAFIKRFDVDGDGTLNYEEFIEFVRPKQFGIQVLSPFGMFYLAVDRLEKMSLVVEKIHTRMFWLQHNNLFAATSFIASAPAFAAAATARQNSSERRRMAPPPKLKVTERFILTHHFGSLRLEFKPNDAIADVVSNGDLIVLIGSEQSPVMETAQVNSRSHKTNTGEHEHLPPFKYRLKPTVKQNLPSLWSWTQLLDREENPGDDNNSKTLNNTSLITSRKASTLRKPSIAVKKKIIATLRHSTVDRNSVPAMGMASQPESNEELHQQNQDEVTKVIETDVVEYQSISAAVAVPSLTVSPGSLGKGSNFNEEHAHLRPVNLLEKNNDDTGHASPSSDNSHEPIASHEDSAEFEFFNDDLEDVVGDTTAPPVEIDYSSSLHHHDTDYPCDMSAEVGAPWLLSHQNGLDFDDVDDEEVPPPPYK